MKTQEQINNRLEQKQAKLAWKESMKRLYPDFSPKKWSKTSYRIKHPQLQNV